MCTETRSYAYVCILPKARSLTRNCLSKLLEVKIHRNTLTDIRRRLIAARRYVIEDGRQLLFDIVNDRRSVGENCRITSESTLSNSTHFSFTPMVKNSMYRKAILLNI